jgi:hypothetical protein
MMTFIGLLLQPMLLVLALLSKEGLLLAMA